VGHPGQQNVPPPSPRNQTKLTLERERLESIKSSFLEWKASHEHKVRGSLQTIEKESTLRKNMINEEINKRELLLNSLKGELQAEKAIKNLFRQEKNVKAQTRARQKAKEQQNLKKLLDFNEFDALLEQASRSTKQMVKA
jgi:hypothetical protein